MCDVSLRVRVAFAAALLGAGCGRSDPPPGQVSGRLTLEGRDLAGVVITFWPEEKAGRPCAAVTSRGGHFRLRCPPGRYKVTVTPQAGDTAQNPEAGPLPMPGVKPAAGAPAIPAFYHQAKTTPFVDIDVPEGGTDAILLDVGPGKGGR
jgi:hypothetical protein